MEVDKSSKIYRKLVCTESEYLAYQIIEKLHADTAKRVLQLMVANRIHQSREIAN